MATALTPEAIERGVQHAFSEIRAAVWQLIDGRHPEYDDNCRRDIGEWLEVIALDRARQIELGGGPYERIDADIRLEHLPGTTTLADLTEWRRWVRVEG